MTGLLLNVLDAQSGMVLALCIGVLLIIRTLLIRNKVIESKINLDDFLLGEDGALSKGAAVMLGSFLLTTWMMVFLTVSGKMTEGYFTSYGGMWIAPILVKVIFGNKQV